MLKFFIKKISVGFMLHHTERQSMHLIRLISIAILSQFSSFTEDDDGHMRNEKGMVQIHLCLTAV